MNGAVRTQSRGQPLSPPGLRYDTSLEWTTRREEGEAHVGHLGLTPAGKQTLQKRRVRPRHTGAEEKLRAQGANARVSFNPIL